MKTTIIAYSLFILVTEPRNTLFFKLFNITLTQIELIFTMVSLFSITTYLNKATKIHNS